MNFESLSRIITDRRSIFPNCYQDKEITEPELMELLTLANWAPTHKKTEPWRFKIFHSLEARKKLSQYLGNAFLKQNEGKAYPEIKYQKTLKKPLQSGCVLAICMQRDPQERIPEWEEIASVACAVQNIWLGCTAKGIGSYWSSPSSILKADEFLGLEDGEQCLGLFYMGYKKDVQLEGVRSPITDKVKFM